MKIQRLQIEQQFIQIGVDSQFAALSISIPTRRMKISRQDAEMDINRQSPDISLDMQDFRNNNGIKDIEAFSEEYTTKAFEHVSRSIRRLASDGDFMGALPSKGNKIAELAKNRMLESHAPQMNSGDVPYGAIKMKGDPGSFNIDWTSHDVKIQWDDYQTPKIIVEPKASVDVYVAREPLIEYTVIEQTIPAESGREIDARA
ncbi:MAG: DUF6470 family protein [Oscillospiraceae bacterium]